MCFYLLYVEEDKEQGALKLHEKKKSKTTYIHHIEKNHLDTQCSRIFILLLFSFYHDGIQGEVTVWLDPQVLREVKSFFFHTLE